MKIATVVGARPQFIKAATVSRLVEQTPDVKEVMIHTGQHYDNNMSELFFKELSIPTPDYHLNIGSKSHGHQTGEMLAAIEDVLLKEKPDVVLVYGDTNSTLAGALAAVKLHIPVAHVEAGLRSFNRKMPEEINRITADHLSEILFPPTKNGEEQLLKEGIPAEKIHRVGDVMYDATLFYNEQNASRRTIVDTLSLKQGDYTLATIHRAENTNCPNRLKHICDALDELAQTMPVILPLHPRTRHILQADPRLKHVFKSVNLIDPVGYLDMLALQKGAVSIITDSGGVQKEAYFNRVPCITLRDETEWVELVEAGWNQLCSPQLPFSLNGYIDSFKQNAPSEREMLYGDGNAAAGVLDVLFHFIASVRC